MQSRLHSEPGGTMKNRQRLTTVRAVLTCIELPPPWLVGHERWRLKLTEEQTPEAVAYCPDCAEREFGR
jgi:hypothetical protein